MSALIYLPDYFILTLFQDWTTLKDAVILDSAFCNKVDRSSLHHVFQISCESILLCHMPIPKLTVRYKFLGQTINRLLLNISSSFQQLENWFHCIGELESQTCCVYHPDFCLKVATTSISFVRKDDKSKLMIFPPDTSERNTNKNTHFGVGYYWPNTSPNNKAPVIYFGNFNKEYGRHGIGAFWWHYECVPHIDISVNDNDIYTNKKIPILKASDLVGNFGEQYKCYTSLHSLKNY
jgi:hypothetical protein